MPLQQTKRWFDLAVPSTKITKKNQAVQVGVHLEEVVEMMQSFKLEGQADDDRVTAILFLHGLAERMKKTDVSMVVTDRKEFLDACADQIVTATGSAHMQGMDIIGAMVEVNTSNFSKFDENGQPIFNEHGKIAKNPATYREPNLAPFIGTDPTT